MFQAKVVDKIKTHFMLSNVFKNRAVYEIKWKNVVESGRPQMTVWLLRIACRIPKATNTHLEYAILLDFTLQQCLHQRPLTL